MGGKAKLSLMEASSLHLFLFDHQKGVHGNDRQRLKPRCLFEIELRPLWGPTFLNCKRGYWVRRGESRTARGE